MSGDRAVLLAIDFGLKRIGVATGNRLTGSATPIETITGKGPAIWTELDRLVAEWAPDRIIVGLPSENESHPLVGRIRAFVTELEARYELPVATVDESDTSAEATSRLRAGRARGLYRRRVTKDRIDRHAACLIAERWMQETRDDL
jgi:putative Holliday junction resolvase